jgi:hypothetical protein
MRSVCRTFAACCSLLGAVGAADLVAVLRLAPRVLDALRHPRALPPRPRLELGAPPGEALVGLLRVAPRRRTLFEERRVAAAVGDDTLQAAVDLDHLGDRARQELAVVADQHRRRLQVLHELLEPVEPVDVEVVGRLVEQVGVVARQQQGREAGARGLPAGQRRGRQRQVDGEPEVGEHRRSAFLEVGAAELQPALERVRVAVVGARHLVAHRCGLGLHRRIGQSNAGAPQQEPLHRLAGHPFGFLRQVAEVAVGRGRGHAAGVGRAQTGEDLQQGRLAGAVRPDQADHVAGGHDQVEAGEQFAAAEAGSEAAGVQGDGHPCSLARPAPGAIAPSPQSSAARS